MVKDEALFLADELEAPLGTVISSEVDRRAAAELRRLHSVNAELLEALKIARPYVSAALAETALVDAYRAERQVDIAIARAEGEGK